MNTNTPQSGPPGLYQRYKQMSPGKRAIIVIFLIWLVQALPKWVVVIAGDDETSAKIMRFFVTPRYEMINSDNISLNLK